ncbi:MAG: hypothetical protein ACREBE_07415 [bacterium]
MARYYTVPLSFTVTAAGGDVDIAALKPAADKPIEIISLVLGQSTEAGDAAEENLDLALIHMTGTITNGSGGAAITPVANRAGTTEVVAAGFTVRGNDTTLTTTSGTSTTQRPFGWNERNNPYERYFPEESRPKAISGEALVLRSLVAVADDINVRGEMVVKEE